MSAADLPLQKPDFTGHWILNVPASTLSPIVAPVVQGGFVRIEHREPTVSSRNAPPRVKKRMAN